MKLNLDGAKRHRKAILKAIKRVVESEYYIRGPECDAFNQEFAQNVGVARCVGVGSGTDAIYLSLLAAGIGTGDEVISPAHNVAYTALAIHMTGATPIFADVDDETMTLDPQATEAAITPRTKAIIPVHLYGHMAPVEALCGIAAHHKLFLLEDACQAHHAAFMAGRAGTWGTAAAFSFYPTKNLGAIGDGGAVVTNHPAFAERVAKLSDGGRIARYEHVLCGMNSGLDELQAAILRVKLQTLAVDTTLRRRVALRYAALNGVRLPTESPRYTHVYHLYVARHQRRDLLLRHLEQSDIPALAHYPIPVHLQPCFKYLGGRKGQFPVAERCADTVVSLPCHPELSELDQNYVIDVVNEFCVAVVEGRP